jgi:hypothetical protein
MKKFSKINNIKVSEQPIIKTNETNETKYKLLQLMDNILSLRSYGPVDNRFLAGKTKIEGKEMLAEAIIDLFTKNESENTVKILESIKSYISDWEVIDDRIDEIQSGDVNFNRKYSINKIIERYTDDSILVKLESVLLGINDVNILNEYSNCIEMSNLSQDIKYKSINLINMKKLSIR